MMLLACHRLAHVCTLIGMQAAVPSPAHFPDSETIAKSGNVLRKKTFTDREMFFLLILMRNLFRLSATY